MSARISEFKVNTSQAEPHYGDLYRVRCEAVRSERRKICDEEVGKSLAILIWLLITGKAI